MKKIIITLLIIILIALFFPKSYFNYPGFTIAKSWKAPTCYGISKKNTNQVPDGPDMLCFGLIIN